MAVLLVLTVLPLTALDALHVEKEAHGLVKLRAGTLTNGIDIRKDISGCFGEKRFVPGKDRKDDELLGEDGEVGVLDVVAADGVYYVLLRASAYPNCNVLGRCGGSPVPDTTLLWLEVGADLTVHKKQPVIVEQCGNIDIDDDDWARKLRLKHGVLDITLTDYEGAKSRISYRSDRAAGGIRVQTWPASEP